MRHFLCCSSERKKKPELLAAVLGDVVLGSEGYRQWVKDFGASDKSQAVYELAAWLDGLGLKLTAHVTQIEK